MVQEVGILEYGNSYISRTIHSFQLYQQGTDLFNSKPTKGVTFLQEQELFSTPTDPGEIVTFLKENPKLDKKQIGEYICNKKHKPILEAYQK